MAAMSQKTRDTLSQMHADERRDQKCLITKRLYQDAKVLVSGIDEKVAQAQNVIDVAIEARNVIQEERDYMLKEAKLFGLMEEVDNRYRTCAIEETHPDIAEFDAITIEGKREILMQK